MLGEKALFANKNKKQQTKIFIVKQKQKAKTKMIFVEHQTTLFIHLKTKPCAKSSAKTNIKT